MKPILTLLLAFIPLSLLAPSERCLHVLEAVKINPYSKIISAIVAIESGGNSLAYNGKEDAAGPFQIRMIRLDHYNKKTGHDYKSEDRFNYEISQSIFLYYASQFSPDDIFSICVSWNGRSIQNKYYKKVQEYLLNQ